MEHNPRNDEGQAMTTATNENAVSVVNSNPMTLIQTAIEHKADPEQLGKLMDLQERFERNEAAKQFAAALADFQTRCPIIKRDRSVNMGGGGYKYASLEDIMLKIKPLLAECGLSVSFSASVDDSGMLTAICTVRCGTHSEPSSITLPVPAEMRVNATQKMGAAMSYAKRYALCAALNITVGDEDSDGAGLGATVTEEQSVVLQDMIDQLDDEASRRFFAWAGVDDVANLPANRYDTAFRGLKKSLGGK